MNLIGIEVADLELTTSGRNTLQHTNLRIIVTQIEELDVRAGVGVRKVVIGHQGFPRREVGVVVRHKGFDSTLVARVVVPEVDDTNSVVTLIVAVADVPQLFIIATEVIDTGQYADHESIVAVT